MNAKEISQLENVELDDNALIPVYTESGGAGKTSLENVRKAMGVNSLTATIDELAPHSTPTADVEKKNVSDFSITFGIPKTNVIETHTVEESTDENGLRKNTITDILSDATQKTYEVKDGIGIKETKVEQKDEDSQISKITLTLTDGSTKEVEVHNGKGIESIEYTPSNLSKGENKIKVKYSDGTESNRFTVLNGKDFRIVHSFKSEEERENSDFKWTDEGGEHEIELLDFVMIDTGSVEDEESGRLYSCADKDGAKVWRYHGDISGCKGDSGTIEIGKVEKGENAEVENVGTPQSAILNFKLPKGDKGDSATVEVGTVETIAPDESASVENVGDEHNAIFNFKIPKGETESFAPVGSIISYAGSEAPAGWLMCDGTVYSGLTYPKLYAILPTEWKDLDNATFSIDLRGRFIIKATNTADNLEEIIDDSKIDAAHTWSSEKVWKMTQTIVLENNIEGIESDTHNFRLNVAGVSAYEDGMTLKVRFRNALQSSQVISEVSIAINGLAAKPLKVSRSNEYVLMTSHQMTTQMNGAAGFDSSHPHRVADNGICLEMSYDSEADAWIVDGDKLVMSYTSTNKGYTIRADGLIEQWGTKKINKRLSGRTSTGLETFDLYALGYTPSPEGLYEIIVDFYIYDDGDYHGSYFTDVEGSDTGDASNASMINTHGTSQSRHTSNSCKLLVSRYLYLRIIWASSATRFNLISIRPVKCPVLMDL